MRVGKVVGQVVSTNKHPSLKGIKLMIVQITSKNQKISHLVATDATHVAGVGDHVYLLASTEGVLALQKGMVATDASIVGIVDPI